MCDEIDATTRDFFEKEFRLVDEVQFQTQVCQNFSISSSLQRLKSIRAIIRPTLNFYDFCELKSEISTEKLYNFDITTKKIMNSVNFSFFKSNGRNKGAYFSGTVENPNFGVIDSKIIFPDDNDCYLSLSGRLSNEKLFGGFGIGAKIDYQLTNIKHQNKTNDNNTEKRLKQFLFGLYYQRLNQLTIFSSCDVKEKLLFHSSICYFFGKTKFNNDGDDGGDGDNNHTTQKHLNQFFSRISFNLQDGFDFSTEVGLHFQLSEHSSWKCKANSDGIVTTKFTTQFLQSINQNNKKNSNSNDKLSVITEVDIWEQIGFAGIQFEYLV